jgi:Fanconi anemia group M protein
MDKLSICMDSNEAARRRDIFNHFLLNEVDVDVKNLDICDYVVSDRVGVERKDTNDFISSIKDGRLFTQIQGIAEKYSHPILILEGGLSKAFKKSRIHSSSVYGALSSIALEYGANIIPTDTPESTAVLLHRIAYREQVDNNRTIQLRSLNKSLPLNEQQIHLISGLPQIGTTLAQELLNIFDTPIKVFNELTNAAIHISPSGKTKRVKGGLAQVKGVGPITVENAQKILKESWKKTVQGKKNKPKPKLENDIYFMGP